MPLYLAFARFNQYFPKIIDGEHLLVTFKSGIDMEQRYIENEPKQFG